MSNDYSAVNDKLTTPAFFSTGQHHDLFKLLRRDDPVHWTEGVNAPRPFWSVVRYSDCVTVLEDAVGFSSQYGGVMPAKAEYPTFDERLENGYGARPTHMDPPLHLQIRQPFNKFWSVPAVSRMKEKVSFCVNEIVREISRVAECDLIQEVCAELPARVVCEMMGVPESDRAKIRYECMAYMGAQDPDFQVDGDEAKTQKTMTKSLYEYALALAIERRKDPREDFTTVIGTLRVDGKLLDERTLGWWCFGIIAAGLETTRNVLGVGLYELMKRPDQADRLRADPSLMSLATEEILRWCTPSKHKFRLATRDIKLGGKLIREGDWVICWLVSANRDEGIFQDADRLDVTRNPNPHIAFSTGEHSCIGRHLARLEIQTMLRAILHEFPGMRVAEEPKWLVSNNSTGLKSLRVRYSHAR